MDEKQTRFHRRPGEYALNALCRCTDGSHEMRFTVLTHQDADDILALEQAKEDAERECAEATRQYVRENREKQAANGEVIRLSHALRDAELRATQANARNLDLQAQLAAAVQALEYVFAEWVAPDQLAEAKADLAGHMNAAALADAAETGASDA